MKIVPLLERKVLYLAYVENVRLNDICRRLKLQKKEAIRLRSKGIEHFKNNLATIYKVQKASTNLKIQANMNFEEKLLDALSNINLTLSYLVANKKNL